jgi:glutaredoxin 3
MKPKTIRLFVKSFCGWCSEAKDWLDERGIVYDEINVSSDRAAFEEMRRLTGQSKAPCIEVDGEVLADFGADELAAWWQQNHFD